MSTVQRMGSRVAGVKKLSLKNFKGTSADIC